MKSIRIGYFADGPWAHRAFERMKEDPEIDIKFICARWDSPDLELKKIANFYGLTFIMERNINSERFREILSVKNCDLFVSMSFNQIFRAPLYSLPRMGTINCHAGKLPNYRGRNILNWVLINDEKDFGITVHYVDDGIDTGDIICQSVYEITDSDTYATLLNRAYMYCAEVLFETIVNIKEGSVQQQAQKRLASPGFYCSKRTAGDERLSWSQSSRDIFNFVRALCIPGPQARTYLGEREIFINRVQLVPQAPSYKGIPGAILGVDEKSFKIKTLDSYIEVLEWSGIDRLKLGDRLK